MTEFDKIIERLGKATGPDRALDRAILRFVSGRVTRDETFIYGSKHGTREIERAYSFNICCLFAPRYTASFDAARSLMNRHHTFAAGDTNEDDLPWACITDCAGADYAATAATTPIALCIAAVRAHEALVTL